eukprot:TRINITY_DN11719_c0_g1_i1.p1 TRINITY_DN11719_c0_g1~~TRINITY_DN11719_c0_g1_i1.p1  ORF type:complete len:255 (+),score=38.32 TRINITY_DN11719_c0_g1_i1:615-1379(+)
MEEPVKYSWIRMNGPIAEPRLQLPKPIKTSLGDYLIAFHVIVAHYLGGLRKKHLTEWYLNRIEQETDDFLVRRGYNLHAVPYNYLDERPKSLNEISHNLALLHELLQPHNFGYLLRTLIQPLKDEIYSEIEAFSRTAKLVLLTLLYGQSAYRYRYDHSAAVEQFHHIRPSLTPQRAQELDDLLHDVSYIAEMRRLDENFHDDVADAPNASADARGKLSDVVPVSGLIFGKLHRLENENKTVLEHWNPSRAQRGR